MSFLVPLFLLGGALIAGPIVAHLIRRSTRERVGFSSLRLLDPSPPRLTRRSRLQHPWLLLLRVLVVLILSLGFARPFLPHAAVTPPPAAPPQRVVVVVDESASMQRDRLWSQAADHVRAIAADLGPADSLTVLAAGGDVRPILSTEEWTRTPPAERAALARRAVADRAPGWGPTRLDTAVEGALDELAAMTDLTGEPAPSRIVLISDFSAGARVAGLAGRDWPPGCEVMLERLKSPGTENASVHPLGWTEDAAGARLVRLRVGHDGNSVSKFQLQLRTVRDQRPLGPPLEIALAPREVRVVTLPVPAGFTDPARIDLSGDQESFDNTAWLLPPQPRRTTLAWLGPAATEDSRQALFYLSRAVEGWHDPLVDIRSIEPGSSTPLPDASVFVVATALSAPRVRELRDHLSAGAFALVLIRDETIVGTAGALAGESDWRPAQAERRDALLGEIDFRHPLFALFADPRFSDFTHVRFWQPHPVALPAGSTATVVARFDDGQPAVIESSEGKGRLVIWAGDWAPAASQWVLSSKFVPWLQSLVERALGGPARPNSAEIGEAARLQAASTAKWRPWPDGAATAATGVPAKPGIYELAENGPARLVALQVPASESRSEALPLETWEELGVPLEAAPLTTSNNRPAAAAQQRSAAALENQQKLWRWLLLAAAAGLALESILAIRVAHRSSVSAPAESAVST